MTREWISDRNHNWVMKCDQTGCATTSEPFPGQPPLDLFLDRSWFIAKKYGDVCPACLAKGVVPKADPYRRVSDR